MKKILSFIVLIIMTIFILDCSLVNANDLEENGLKISREVKKRDTGWGANGAEILMLLRNRQGQESVRELRIKSIEQLNDGDKNLIVFDKPKDIKGTAFLSFSHSVGADDQWLYLPALKRVKRIDSRNKSGPFMGSEFAFEDLNSFEIEKYTYKYIKEEIIDDKNHFVIEQYPVDENSGYTRRVVWVDGMEYRFKKIDFYDRKNTLLKTLTFNDYQMYAGKYWRADEMMMLNHQNGKTTRLKWSNYDFNIALNDKDFNKNSLKRIR